MPLQGRAAALERAAQMGELLAVPLRAYPEPPWDYESLLAIRTRHAETPLSTGAPGDVQTTGAVVTVVGTAKIRHPLGLMEPETIAALAIVSYYEGEPILYGVVILAPPMTTTPGGAPAEAPLSVWDSFPYG
jgi:hypothetical protein